MMRPETMAKAEGSAMAGAGWEDAKENKWPVIILACQ